MSLTPPPGPGACASVWLVDVATHAERWLAWGHWPSWSADGRAVVITGTPEGATPCNSESAGFCNGELMIAELNGHVRDLGVLGEQPSWSPDGSWIAYFHSSTVPAARTSEIDLISPNGERHIALTHGTTFDSDPSWSSDGRQIVFCSRRDDAIDHQIYVMNADGSHPRRLTKTQRGGEDPAFRPDPR
jgi:Tol biopolymer transport system component